MNEQNGAGPKVSARTGFRILASDYDGTLASQGRVSDRALEAIHSFREAGNTFVLVTGRILAELKDVFPAYRLCDWIVAENGPVIYCPARDEERLLATPPPDEFILALRHREVTPLDVGRIVVATREPHEDTVLDVIREQGLELQMIFNKGAVMVLPPGTNKGIGLSAVLQELGATPEEVVAVGDAENDHSLLKLSGFAAAVSNALPALKERADHVLEERSTEGVLELMNGMLTDGLASLRYLVKERVSEDPVTVVAPSVEDAVEVPPTT